MLVLGFDEAGERLQCRFEGVLDVTAARELEALEEAVPPGQPVELDLTEVERIEPAGLEALADLRRALQAQGHEVTVRWSERQHARSASWS